MTMAQQLRRKLEAAFQPLKLEIVDESGKHAGHAGARPGGETHFRLTIVAAGFAGQSRLARQRRVNEVLAEELKGGVHALAMTVLAPGEPGG
jgi:BolA family transcriptional regulator, general stress-responsive regulator